MTSLAHPVRPALPSAAARARLYPSRFSESYIVLSDIRRAISRYSGEISGKLLDYGCDCRPYAPLFPRVSEYLGADFAHNSDAEITLDASGKLPCDEDDFDAVISTQVLEHVPEVDQYLAECQRVLAQRTGTIVLSTHGIWEYHPYAHDLYRWTHEGLIHVTERAGFKVQAVDCVSTGYRSLLQSLCLMIDKQGVRRRRKKPLYFAINALADRLRDDPGSSRHYYGMPICYLYVGQAGR